MLKKLLPSLIIMLVLLLAGAIMHWMGRPVYWPGFIAMMFFYAAIFYIGTYAANMKGQDTEDSVMLAGRSLPLGVAIFTMSATWVGGGYINGTAEYTSSSGLAWVQAPWGYALSLIFGGLFFARKMRRYEFKTMIDPLEQRFGKNVAAALSLPAITGELFWTSAILTALGTTFGTVLGMDFVPSIILSAAIAIAYTALGGLWAVAFTDVIQMILLFFGLILVVPFALDKVGGWDYAWATYQENKGIYANLFPPLDGWKNELWGDYYWNWWDSALLLIFGGIPWQVYFQRVLASKNEKVAMRLSIIAGFVCLIAAIPAIMIGVIGNVVDWNALGIAPPEDAALTLPYVVRYLTNPIVATIGLGAIAAAVMSSVDSSILSASSMASWNLYRKLYKPKIDSKSLAKVIKKVIWIIGIAATLIALQVQSVYALWFLCSDLVYCLLFPPLVCALFDKKANRFGAIAGLVVSAFLRFGAGEPAFGLEAILPYPMTQADGAVLFPFRTLAMACGLISILVVSRLTQKSCPPLALQKMG
ncbi:sodium:solute symporter family protein [Algoriphagus persicinus]|uniref:sodium:solute symporter family protein n=1 Tax=Algoriphagus persicinus TaxID=3108754 RepID=UPI002B370859|nr:sodium:solute symporter family protein [Algoriphagus sp. E1-3-M2]MEB2783384.1 sodium:solute symporter family protein [Algoriphagus sp. E1-3-M2]